MSRLTIFAALALMFIVAPIRADDDQCPDLYRVGDTDLCSHGPDEAFDVQAAGTVPPGTIPPEQPSACGDDGKRAQAMYVRVVDQPDRYAESVAIIRQSLMAADQIFDQSAHRTGGHRHIRFVTDNCEISVLKVTVSEFDGVGRTIGHLIDQGYSNPDRHYIAFVDGAPWCGIATIISDDQPGAANLNNLESGYAVVGRMCWSSGWLVAHEITHLLGAVQISAPHASGGWHCTDDYDLMCYSDPPRYPPIHVACLEASAQWLLDCNNDDYFHTDPQPGNYLAAHWNVALSPYLTDYEPPIVELWSVWRFPMVMN